jgi:putative colanic acid biosysnthesis UDP-glucose lipid carrier transferase
MGHARRSDVSKGELLGRYLRRGDTVVARALRIIAPQRGLAYTSACSKRALDLTVGLPVAALGLPVAVVLAVINRSLQPRLAPWYVQHRAGQGQPMRIVKLRSMEPRVRSNTTPYHIYEPARVTPLGRFMRRYDLDELPQLLDVLAGRLSLVGIRVLPMPVYEHLRERWPAWRFERWSEAYTTSRLGLTGVHQVFRGAGKEDQQRYHRDVFYAHRATLGFDLYLLWKTGYQMARGRRGRYAGRL